MKSIATVIFLIAMIGIIGFMISDGDITGGAVANTISCYENTDCDDGITATEDTCKNDSVS